MTEHAPASGARSSLHAEPTDAELVERFRCASDSDGEPFLVIYRRYRDGVRRALEENGLSRMDAERRVGEVFVRVLDRRTLGDLADGRPLEERLISGARAAAASPERPPG